MSAVDKWWYADDSDQLCGPFSVAHIANLFNEGHIDGLTFVTTDFSLPRDEWLPLSEAIEIRKAIDEAVDEAEEKTEVDSALLVSVEKDSNPEQDASLVADSSHAEERTVKERENDNKSQPEDLEPDSEKAAALAEKRLEKKRKRAIKRLKNRAATNVYVTGIPTDATVEEVASFFSKCGIILPNSENGKPRVKLYTTETGELKGDALITYALAPSVENALQILDGVPLRYHGTPMSVQRATFDHKIDTEKAEENTESQGKRPRRLAGSRALVADALNWDNSDTRSSAPRIVILRNVFDVASADYDLIREDMAEGCAECGEVEKITVFERNPEGVVAIKFIKTEAAKACIKLMDGRWYDQRQLSAQFFDGVTDYRQKESEEALQERDKEWEAWLEGNDRS